MRSILMLTMGIIAAPALGASEVDLEWRAGSANIRVGDTVDLGLFAVSATGEDVLLLGVKTIISWDPGVMELVDVVDVSPFTFSGFFADDELDGLNADCGPDAFCIPYTSFPRAKVKYCPALSANAASLFTSIT